MIEIFDMEEQDAQLISSCFYKIESEAEEEAAKIRQDFLLQADQNQLIVKIAYGEGRLLGYAHGFFSDNILGFIEGANYLSVPCVHVNKNAAGDLKGVGRALMEAMEQESRDRDLNGTALLAFEGRNFMPREAFLKMGYKIDKNYQNASILKKSNREKEVPLNFLFPRYPFEKKADTVTIDIFYNPFCFKSIKEKLLVENYCKAVMENIRITCYNSLVFPEFQIPSGIFVEGKRLSESLLKEEHTFLNLLYGEIEAKAVKE